MSGILSHAPRIYIYIYIYKDRGVIQKDLNPNQDFKFIYISRHLYGP